MKDQSVMDFSSSTSPNQNGEQEDKKPHCRGDKVVVNGAKESLLSILRKYKCGCGKHTLQKLTTKFLSSNKITASYDIIVWMLMYIEKMTSFSIYSQILENYLSKMNDKLNFEETHQSPEYIQSKKETLKKFIKSGKALSQQNLNIDTLQKSIYDLYSKPKSAQNATIKIKAFLRSWKSKNQSSCFLSDETKQIQIKNSESMQQRNQLIQQVQTLEQVCSKQESEEERIQESTQTLIQDQISVPFDNYRTSSKVEDFQGFCFTQLQLMPEKQSNSSGDLFSQLLEENQFGYPW